MPVTAGIVGGISAAGSIGSSILGSNASSSAATAQETAAQKVAAQANTAAATSTGQVAAATGTADTGLAAGETQGNNVISGALTSQQANLSPYMQAGTTSLSSLQSDLSGLTNPNSQFNFNPTTSPQLQFEQQQAQQALQRQEAAQGTVQGGGDIRSSDIMNTGLASTYLNQAFNQALSQYNTNRQNTLTQIQGLTNLTGLGYNATANSNQDIGQAANLTNTNIQNTSARTAANQINAGTYAGNQTNVAAGVGEQSTIAAANAQSANDIAQGKVWGGLATNLTGSAGQLYGLSQAPGGGYGGGGSTNGGSSGGGWVDPSDFPGAGSFAIS